MKNIESSNAQVKQASDEYLRSAILYLDPNRRQSKNDFAVIFAIVAAILIWAVVLFIVGRIEFG